MKKLIITILLFCSVLTYSQIPFPGVVASQGTSIIANPEMISNGVFTNGTDWTAGAGWTIGGGVATYDDVTNGATLSQADGDMISSITINTNYRLEFDIVVSGSQGYFGVFDSGIGNIYIAPTTYTTGHKIIDFTTPGFIDVKGIGFYAYTVSDGTFTIDNISLKKR
jgi:hypothetical protein